MPARTAQWDFDILLYNLGRRQCVPQDQLRSVRPQFAKRRLEIQEGSASTDVSGN